MIQKFQLSGSHISHVTQQMLCGLLAVHCAGIIDKHLKPDNPLIAESLVVKTCDFGLARWPDTDGTSHGSLTEYVATSCYRAPKISLYRYDKAADIWSSDCVLAEMLGGTALFPGRDPTQQLDCIFAVLGSPTDDDLRVSYTARSIQYIREVLPVREKRPWRELYPNASESSLDLLDQLLTLNMKSRLSAEDVLQHPYVQVWTESSQLSFEGASTQHALKGQPRAEGKCKSKA